MVKVTVEEHHSEQTHVHRLVTKSLPEEEGVNSRGVVGEWQRALQIK